MLMCSFAEPHTVSGVWVCGFIYHGSIAFSNPLNGGAAVRFGAKEEHFRILVTVAP
jgi:hypothetical protein